jgi:4-diphosphocytidyl-2-C-methyl-D-erythritol kinase
LHAVLVNPGVRLATRDVFAKYKGGQQMHALAPQAVPRELGAFIDFLKANGNDLTGAAIACAPVVAAVLKALGNQPGALLSRMSGSGSTCFALLTTAEEAAAAASHLAAARKDWWVRATVFGVAT